MGAAYSSETSTSVYKNIRYHNQEDQNLNYHLRDMRVEFLVSLSWDANTIFLVRNFTLPKSGLKGHYLFSVLATVLSWSLVL
jgi:hypothetical protein